MQATLPSLLHTGSTSAMHRRQISSLRLRHIETSSDAHGREMYAVHESTAATIVRQFDHKLIVHSQVVVDSPHAVSELHTVT